MEIEIANGIHNMNINSFTGVNDGIKDGDIPDWLLLELFIRLPQKDVFRCKVVSKQWISVILDPAFIKIYCSRALSLHKLQPWTFIQAFSFTQNNPVCELLVDIYSVNLKWPSCYTLPLPRFPHPIETGYTIYGVSNGFVIYGPRMFPEEELWKSVDYRIYNLVTGQSISLPSHLNHRFDYWDSITGGSWGFMTNVVDEVLMSYTVVCLFVSDDYSGKFIICEVFLSEVGEWKKYIVPIDTTIVVADKSSSTVINGVMHWMLRDELGLIAYDPHNYPDLVRTIALPGDIVYFPHHHMCTAYQGKVRYFKASSFPPKHDTFQSFNIWVLSDYSSGDWCLQHRVNYGDIHICSALSGENLFLLPLSFHPYDSDIVYFGYTRMILSYNIKTRKLEVQEEFEIENNDMEVITIYELLETHILLIPPWPVSFSRPSVRA